MTRLRRSGCFLYLLALVAILAPLPAAVAQDASVYAADVPVASQDEGERTRALAPALAQVLVKVSGDPTIGGDARLGALLQRATTLATQFSYRQSAAASPGAAPRLHLMVQFDSAGVDALLAELGRSVWGADRPPTLVWLVIDDGVRKTIASAAQVGALGALTGQARERGVPLKFPSMDREDAARIDAETLWSGAPVTALSAAERYRTPACLIARLSRSGNGWNGRFTLVDALGNENWSATFSDSNSVLVAGAAGLADRLARRYAVAANERVVAEYRVWVGNLDSAEDYGRVLDYLRGLSVVRAVEPEGADADRLLLRVTLNVTLERLRQVLTLAQVLAFEDSPPPLGAQAALRLVR